MRYAIAALAMLGLLVLPANAQGYGGCTSEFAKLIAEGAEISLIEGVVIDRDRRQVTYVLPDRREHVSFPGGEAELRAVQKELRFVRKSWYLILKLGGNRWQPHYARDTDDGCEHYSLGLPGKSG